MSKLTYKDQHKEGSEYSAIETSVNNLNGNAKELLMNGTLSGINNPSYSDAISILNNIRVKNVNKLVIGNLNINTFAGKFYQFKIIIQGKLDIIVVTETKVDDSYPTSQFFIEGFCKPYRMDRNKHGGGILIYIREDIPSKQLSKHNFTKHIEGMFIEINLRKTRWLLFGTYHPPSQSDKEYFEQVGLALDVYSDYGKFLLTGDFNAEDSESCLKDFLYHYDAKNLVKQKT